MPYITTPNKAYKIPTVATLAADWPDYIQETIEKIDADLVGNIIPDGDNTRDIGSTDKRYHAVYANEVRGDVLYGNGANLTGITGATGGIANAGSTTIGADTDSSGDGVIALQTRLLDRLVILNNGNVGIGTTTPGAALQIGSSTHALKLDYSGSDYSVVSVNTADGTDNKRLYLSGGGGSSWGRGALIELYGNEYSGQEGTMALRAGSVSGHINLHVNGGYIAFLGSAGEKVRMTDDGKVGIGTATPTISGTGKLHLAGDTIRLASSRTPASAGNQGEVCWDSSYIYVCIATNSWKRAALAAW